MAGRIVGWKEVERGDLRAVVVRSENARQSREEIMPIVTALRTEGLVPQGRQMAERLNSEGWTTRTGHAWTDVTVCKLLKKCEQERNGGEW